MVASSEPHASVDFVSVKQQIVCALVKVTIDVTVKGQFQKFVT